MSGGRFNYPFNLDGESEQKLVVCWLGCTCMYVILLMLP